MSARIIAPLVLGAVMLGLWEAAVRAAGIPPYILPGPILVAKTLVADWGTLAPSLLVTVEITLEALAAAVVVGGLLAVLLALSRWLERSLDAYAVIPQATLVVAIAPLIIVWVNDVRALAIGLRLARRVLSDPVEHHPRPSLRPPQPARPFELYGARRWQHAD